MELKSLNELNLEFQAETSARHNNNDNAENDNKIGALELIKPIVIDIDPPKSDTPENIKNMQDMRDIQAAGQTDKIYKPELKSIDELNLEFRTETAAAPRNSGQLFERFQPITLMEPASFGLPESEHMQYIKPAEPLIAEIEPPAIPDAEITAGEFPGRQAEISGKIKKNRKGAKKPRSMFALISDMLFYMAIFTILVAILTSSSGNGGGAIKTVMGYSYFTVLTPSMQDEIPQGSFILVKQTEPEELNIGDNITFMKDANTSVTHKISDIYENYDNSGARGFQTKGVNNPDPDNDIVYEANIIGKVIVVIPSMGTAISYLRANIYIVFIIFGLFILLSFLLRQLFAKPVKSPGSAKSVKPADSSSATEGLKGLNDMNDMNLEK